MERKIGETFEFEGKTYKVVKHNGCANCAFRYNDCPNLTSVIGNCMDLIRSDGVRVMFKEIKDMEIKDNKLTINIPEGMEIDIANCDLKAGVIKFKKKEITYEDVALLAGSYCTISVSHINYEKLKAIDKLMDIAKYYNGDWKPDWSNIDEPKFLILYSNRDERYTVDYNTTFSINAVPFKHKEDALAVIDNPNFREI